MSDSLMNTSSRSIAGNSTSDSSLYALCQRYKAIVLHQDESSLRVACHETQSDIDGLRKALQFTCGLKIQIEPWSQARFEQALEHSATEPPRFSWRVFELCSRCQIFARV